MRRTLYDWSAHPSVPLHHKIIGEKETSHARRPIAILHGLLGFHRNWSGLGKTVVRLSGGRPVLICDARNHGLSPHTESHTYFEQAADARRLFEDRGLRDVTLIGHSMGAMASMLLCLLG